MNQQYPALDQTGSSSGFSSFDIGHDSLPRRAVLQWMSASALGCIPLLSRAADRMAGEITMLEAINQAGRQRMLSQRVAKLYAQQIKRIRKSEASRLLAASINLFDTQLETLHRFAQNHAADQIVQTYNKLGTLWNDYKKVAIAEATMDGLETIVVLNEQVLVTANDATVQLEKLHGGSLGRLVNMAGRQRMLSQRMSKFYFFRGCGINTIEVSRGLDIARSEFIVAMRTLKTAPEDNQSILSWLALGEGQWAFFNDAVSAHGGTLDDADQRDNDVAVTSENLLQVMEKVASLYAALSPV